MYSIIRHREGQVVNRMELKMSRRRRMQDVLVGLGIDQKLEGILAVNSELGEENVELEDGAIRYRSFRPLQVDWS